MPMRNLNLLLKQQIVRHINQTDTLVNFYAMNGAGEENVSEYEDEGKLRVEDVLQEEDTTENLYYENVKMELANIQIEESVSTEKHKSLRDNYQLLENLMEHVLHHIECVILELNSTNRLVVLLKYFSQDKNLDETSSESLKILSQRPEIRILEEAKTKLLSSLTNNEDTQTLFRSFEDRKNNYNLALKNFRIILEILNLPEDSVLKLKDQFDDVLVNYQHSRRILDQQLPYVIADKSRTLSEVLALLGDEYNECFESRKQLASILKNLGKNLGECGYFVGNKDIMSYNKKATTKIG